nr:MAG TPA: protein of unknown function (DUF5048) [Bacteriophage sp.]
MVKLLDISTEFKNELFNDNRDFLPFLDITLRNGKVLNLTRKDVWQNSMSIEDATSAGNTFTIGAAVTGKLTVTLNNIYDDFSEYDFSDATVVAYVGLQLSNALEKVRVGTFVVDEPSYDGSTISLTFLDNMVKFDKPYSKSTLQYPATLGQILADACNCCGVSLQSANFPNKGYVVKNRPKDDALTFGDIIACVAQVAGCWAKMDVYGRLKLGWYNMSVFEKNANLNGGTFETSTTPYSDGDTVDGGNFKDYSSGASLDGGTFVDQKAYHHIFSTKTFTMSTDDAVITGIRVTEEFEETETDKPATRLVGNEGYVVEVSGNALIQKGAAQTVANYLYNRIGGMRFRPLEVECLTNPAIEAGDIAYVTDRKQNSYQAFISTREFHLGGVEKLVCDAETPLKNSQTRFSEMTKAVVKARKQTQRQLSAYDLAVQQLTNLMTQSFGVFKSEEVLEDGSIIYYMHNKPERATSSTIWKMTADAFAVSTDGGQIWNAGIDSQGNAVVSVLNAIGINADWINAGSMLIGGAYRNQDGTITVCDASNNVIFKVSKSGIIINTQNLKVAQNGNIEVTGKLVGMDKIYLRNTTQGVDRSVIQYKYTKENQQYQFLTPDGKIFLETSQQETPLYFPLLTKLRYAEIGKLNQVSTDFATTKGTYTTEAGYTVVDVRNYVVSGTVRASGAFIEITGKINLKSLEAGQKIEYDLANSAMETMPIPSGYLPKHDSVQTIAVIGTRVIYIRLNKEGVLLMRNCGEKYENTDGTDVHFRFDYTLM